MSSTGADNGAITRRGVLQFGVIGGLTVAGLTACARIADPKAEKLELASARGPDAVSERLHLGSGDFGLPG